MDKLRELKNKVVGSSASAGAGPSSASGGPSSQQVSRADPRRGESSCSYWTAQWAAREGFQQPLPAAPPASGSVRPGTPAGAVRLRPAAPMCEQLHHPADCANHSPKRFLGADGCGRIQHGGAGRRTARHLHRGPQALPHLGKPAGFVLRRGRCNADPHTMNMCWRARLGATSPEATSCALPSCAYAYLLVLPLLPAQQRC